MKNSNKYEKREYENLRRGIKMLIKITNRHIWTLFYIAFIIFIFSNSMQVATESARQSADVLHYLQEFLGTGWLTDHIVRKAAHFSEFALLGILGVQCMRQYTGRCMLPTLFTGLLTALTDETIQLLVEGRSGQVSDVWIDFAGCCCGAMALKVVLHFLW